VPFIVPRRQTYLPQFVIDLREQANSAKNRQAIEEEPLPLSGPAQVLLLFHLQMADRAEAWSLRTWARTLGYSTMTATRICDELARRDLCQTETNGKRVTLQFDGDRHALWTRALPYLRSPVKKTVCVARAELPELDCCCAGLTALAQYTLIAEGKNPVYAMSASEYRRAEMSHLIDEQEYLEKDSLIIEQWRYRPKVLTHDQVVDRLSLYLALRDERDERIEAALGDLLEGVKW
jgi:DNA-binding MarR family transcriptional regulator